MMTQLGHTPPVREPVLVLLVDDEPQIHRFLRPTLEAAGYLVARADTGAEALRQTAMRQPALILLDLGLPDADGQDILVQLGAVSGAPVIVLSARDRAAEKIRALDAGAVDYVEKPFDMGELLARIRAALRPGRPVDEPEGAVQVGPIDMDFLHRRVRVNGASIQLTPREYDLLALLMRNPNRVITHRQLLTAVWGPAHTADVQYLRVYIGHLRQKLGQAAAALITTEPGIGYRLVPESEPALRDSLPSGFVINS
jgi:two-component system KDP operon response regulator KdpE